MKIMLDYHAEYLLSHRAYTIGLKLPVKRLYAIDVCSSFSSLTFQSISSLQNNPVEVLVNDAERYYFAESLQSILVCTGV